MRALNRLMAGAGLALAFSIASGLEREARAQPQPQPQPVPAPPARERQLPPSARRQAETLAALRDIRARLDAVAGVDDLAALDADIARLVQTLKPPEPSGVAAVLSPYNDMLQIVTLLSTVSSLIGFGIALYQIQQARDATREANQMASDLNRFREGMNRYTDDMRRTVDGIIRGLERTAALSRHNAETETATTHINRAMRALEGGEERDERIGDFPAMLSYLTGRLQNARSLVILQIPFMQFGVLGNPRGQWEFRQTLYERFREDLPGTGAELAILTYPDAERQALAARRYARAPDALRQLFDRAVTDQLLERCIDPEIVEPLWEAIYTFQDGLTDPMKERMLELARDQLRKEMKDDVFNARIYKLQTERDLSYFDAGDELFADTLADSYEKNLFVRITAVRRALNATLAMQEPLTEFPRRSTVIRVEPIFDNQMTLCLNGEEVMTCHADLRDIEGRDNRVESRMGQHHLFDAKDEFEKILEKSEQRIKIMNTFEECIRAAASRPSLRNMSKRIDDILLRLPKP